MFRLHLSRYYLPTEIAARPRHYKYGNSLVARHARRNPILNTMDMQGNRALIGLARKRLK